MKAASQGRRVIAALKRKPHTYMQMLALGCGYSPWKRCQECLHHNERLLRAKNARGLVCWRVVPA